jgi:hypothetical protein
MGFESGALLEPRQNQSEGIAQILAGGWPNWIENHLDNNKLKRSSRFPIANNPDAGRLCPFPWTPERKAFPSRGPLLNCNLRCTLEGNEAGKISTKESRKIIRKVTGKKI